MTNNIDPTSLSDLPRKDLQKLCKQLGIKANGKTSELVRLILEENAKNPQAAVEFLSDVNDVPILNQNLTQTNAKVDQLKQWLDENGHSSLYDLLVAEQFDLETLKLATAESLRAIGIPMAVALKLRMTFEAKPDDQSVTDLRQEIEDLKRTVADLTSRLSSAEASNKRKQDELDGDIEPSKRLRQSFSQSIDAAPSTPVIARQRKRWEDSPKVLKLWASPQSTTML